MLSRLKAVLAQHPLTGFFALAGAAYAVSVWVMAAGSPLWLNHFHQLTVVVLGLVTLTCCWATSGPRDQPPQRVTQLFIVVSVTLFVMVAGLLRIWATWLWARSHPFTGTYPVGQMVRHELSDTWSWLPALVVGLVLAGIVSPFPAVRRTSRALVAWRSTRVWRLIVVTLLLLACCIAFAWAGVRFVTTDRGSVPSYTRSAPYVAAAFAWALLTYVPLIFAWYGFVARRLRWRRQSPLVIGMLIGLGLVMPGRLAFAAAGLGFPRDTLGVLEIAADVALAVLGIWLAWKARGSLLPTAVLFAGFFVGPLMATWLSPSPWREMNAYELYLVGFIVAAAAFVVAGRMWRRPKVAAASPPLDESRPPTDRPFALTP